MTRADVEAWADAADVALVCVDGMDDAIVGIGQRFTSYFVVYDEPAVMAALITQGLSEADAREWFDVNIVGAWVGEETPCFLRRAIDDA